jgi:hypothetical protein
VNEIAVRWQSLEAVFEAWAELAVRCYREQKSPGAVPSVREVPADLEESLGVPDGKDNGKLGAP